MPESNSKTPGSFQVLGEQGVKGCRPPKSDQWPSPRLNSVASLYGGVGRRTAVGAPTPAGREFWCSTAVAMRSARAATARSPAWVAASSVAMSALFEWAAMLCTRTCLPAAWRALAPPLIAMPRGSTRAVPCHLYERYSELCWSPWPAATPWHLAIQGPPATLRFATSCPLAPRRLAATPLACSCHVHCGGATSGDHMAGGNLKT